MSRARIDVTGVVAGIVFVWLAMAILLQEVGIFEFDLRALAPFTLIAVGLAVGMATLTRKLSTST